MTIAGPPSFRPGATGESSVELLIRDPAMISQFINDLRAADRFKQYLVATGATLPEQLTTGLAELCARAFSSGADSP